MEFWTRSLAAALSELETNADLVTSSIGRADPALERAFRTASIKSFEYTYGLSIKAIERTLSDRTGQPVTVEVSQFRPLLRMAWEMGLVRTADEWLEFRDMRNATSHTYSDKKAAIVFAGIGAFVGAVRYLLRKLQEPADAS
jgi:nucleotidyltransferase substrate binding protein (TIGR01987 family)